MIVTRSVIHFRDEGGRIFRAAGLRICLPLRPVLYSDSGGSKVHRDNCLVDTGNACNVYTDETVTLQIDRHQGTRNTHHWL